jgi:hypothetical protein
LLGLLCLHADGVKINQRQLRSKAWQAKRVCVQIDLETKLEVKRNLNVFKFDPDFEQSEAEWAAIRAELLGESSEDEDGQDGEGGESGSEDESEEDAAPTQALQTQVRFSAPVLAELKSKK